MHEYEQKLNKSILTSNLKIRNFLEENGSNKKWA